MSARMLTAVTFGPVAGDVGSALPGVPVIDATGVATPDALAAAAGIASGDVLWLPPWIVPSAALAGAVRAWRDDGASGASAGASAGVAGGDARAPRVARAQLRLHCGAGVVASIGPRVVLSGPGAVTLAGDRPQRLASARLVDIDEPWDVALPGSLSAHLEAVNAQSSAAARLRHAAGLDARWSDLTLAPLALALRGLASARGSRRVALPRLVIEAYREVLVAAKLWELTHATPAS